ncbi:alpha/beta fold hydrolase [Mesobacillus foraminis]|uniref:alpha/beta fold hydrolase n=1 Tax=Mesobacillus foraminis TaxID=279826 RepID=UPI000EF4F3C1|nr:alpha/beta fold hydrolase [Mesobacillus foraminis]
MKIVKSKVETSKGHLEFNISGNGKPNIVLLNGGSGPIEGWMRILPEVSELASVFSYNRFGVDDSDKPQEPQHGVTIVKTLREALSIVGFEPPFLLVGHSLGGLYANLFARLYPNEVAGIVFVESSHPRDLTLEKLQGKAIKAINNVLKKFDSLSSHKQYNEVHFVEETVNQINQHNFFPDIPVYVISGGKENRMMPKEARKIRQENQLELLSLSTNSKLVVAGKSGHFPQMSEPRVVIDTIKDCAAQISMKI